MFIATLSTIFMIWNNLNPQRHMNEEVVVQVHCNYKNDEIMHFTATCKNWRASCEVK